MLVFFETLKTQYDYIIVDSPPVGLVSDPIDDRESTATRFYTYFDTRKTAKEATRDQ
jgi:hypothetical protein